MKNNIIYRLDNNPEIIQNPEGIRFLIVDSIGRAFKIIPTLFVQFGAWSSLKTFMKVFSKSRVYYCSILDKKIASDGWIMFGRCHAYAIPKSGAVIGPINTYGQYERRGFASFSLSRAAVYSFYRGSSVVYINTTVENIASQKTILKVGFVEDRREEF